MKQLILVVAIILAGCKEKKTEPPVSLIKTDSLLKKDTITHDGDTSFVVKAGTMTYKTKKCPLDTVKGILYRAGEYGNNWVETGYYIAFCGGLQIGRVPFMGQEDAPIWIPGIFLRNDEVDEKGNLKYKEFQTQYNVGVFTDEHFNVIEPSSVYGLLVFKKK